MFDGLKNLLGVLNQFLANLFGSGNGQAMGKVTKLDPNEYAAPALVLQGSAETTTKLNENVIVSIKGDVSPDGNNFIVKSLAANKRDGGLLSALIILEKPVVLTVDAQGQINLDDAKLQESLKRLDRRIQEDMTEKQQLITVSAKHPKEGQSNFSFSVRAGTLYHVYEGEIDADKSARITSFTDGREKVKLSSPISVSLSPDNNAAIMISRQKLWDIARSASQQAAKDTKASDAEYLLSALSDAYRKGMFQDIPAGGHVVPGTQRNLRTRDLSS